MMRSSQGRSSHAMLACIATGKHSHSRDLQQVDQGWQSRRKALVRPLRQAAIHQLSARACIMQASAQHELLQLDCRPSNAACLLRSCTTFASGTDANTQRHFACVLADSLGSLTSSWLLSVSRDTRAELCFKLGRGIRAWVCRTCVLVCNVAGSEFGSIVKWQGGAVGLNDIAEQGCSS